MNSESAFYEKQLTTTKVFEGVLLHVYQDTVLLPNGNRSIREYIKHPGAAVVIPHLGNHQILLIRQYRYPIRQIVLELPAGKIDPGESPEMTIQRELTEETGYQANWLKPIAPIHTCVGYSDEIIHLYWADQLTPASRLPDADEFIETTTYSISQAMSLVHNGQITDAKTLIGLFWADSIIRNPQLSQKYLPT
jgi:ADP-ribose pyrophosphatase